MRDERLGLAVVELEPLLDRLRRVVCPPLFARRAGAGARARPRRGPGARRRPSSGAADLGQHRVERLRLGHRARKAVEHEPLRRVVGWQPLPDQLDHQLVGDELAALEDRLARAARARCRAATAARSMSPVAMCGMPYSAAIRFACVPLPAPWGPSRRMSSGTLLEEALVGAHHHLRLHLAHRVERDADRRSAPRCRRARARSPARSRSSG